MNRSVRSSQSRANSSRGRPGAQNNQTLGRVFHLTQEEVRATSDVVIDTLPMNNFNVFMLFELGVTHSFITRRIVTKIGKRVKTIKKKKKGFIIGTFTGNRL
jgi:hypothetical protein